MNEDIEREEGTQEEEQEEEFEESGAEEQETQEDREMNLDDLLEEPQDSSQPEEEAQDEAEGEEENESEGNPPATRQETPPPAAPEKGAINQAEITEKMKIVQSIAGHETAKAFLKDPAAREAILSGADVYTAFARYRERTEQAAKPRRGVPSTRQSSTRTAKRSVANLSDDDFAKAFDSALYEAERGAKVFFE